MSAGTLLANDGAGLRVADEHASDQVVGLRLHAGVALHVLVHPHMHLVQRVLQCSDARPQHGFDDAHG